MDMIERTGGSLTGWLRNGFLSGRVSGVVRAFTDVVYYIAFSFCFSWTFVRSSTLFNGIMTHEQRTYLNDLRKIAILAAIICAALMLLMEKKIWLAVIEAALLAAGYINWTDGCRQIFLFAMCAMIAGATGRSFRMVLPLTLIEGTILMAGAFAASQTGMIEDLVYSGNRHSFGIIYCTDCAAHVLFLMLTWLMLRIELLRLRDLLPLPFCLCFMYFTHAKTNILCSLFMITGTVIYIVTARRWGRRIWKIPAAVLCFSYPVSAAVSLGMALFADIENVSLRTALDSVDRSLVKRLEMSRRAFEENPVTWFGAKIKEKSFGGKVGGFEGWDKYFFIDNSYIRLLFFGGIILFVLLLLIMTWAQLRCFASGNYGCVFLLSVVALTCIMEHHLSEFYYNVFPLMAFAGGSFFRKKRMGPEKKGPRPDPAGTEPPQMEETAREVKI